MGGSSKRGVKARKLQVPAWITMLFWVLVAPGLMIGLGAWEYKRSSADMANYGPRQASVAKSLEKLRQLAATNPTETVKFHNDPIAYTAPEALERLQSGATYIGETVLLSRVRVMLSQGAMGGGAVAIVASLVGLLAASLAALMARRSREQLVHGFALLRRILPFLLVLQLAGLAIGFVCIVLFEIGGIWFQDEVSTGEMKVALCGLIFAGLALYATYAALLGLRKVFALLAPEPTDVEGEAVDEAKAPGLWMLVRELAKSQQALMPDAIVVGLTGGFFVTSSAVRVLPAKTALTGRTLYLPAPYLGLLTLKELAAIIGHELAHFSGEDTIYSQRFSPIYQGLTRAIEQLGELKGVGGMLLTPSTKLGFHAMSTFDAAVGRWSQRREFDADRLGSTVSGSQAAASALLRTGVIAAVIDKVLGKAFESPAAAPENLVAETERVAAEAGWGDPTPHLEDRKPHPTDSHPATRRRIEALGIAVDDALLAEATRPAGADANKLAPRLFADWAALCQRLSATFLARGRKAAAAHKAFLQKTAAAMPQGETRVMDNNRAILIIRGVATLALFAGAVASVLYSLYGGPQGATPVYRFAIPAAAAALGLLALYATFRVVRRLGKPCIVLDQEGIHAPLLAGVVPWTDLETFQVTSQNGKAFTLHLYLAADSALPQASGWSMRFRRRPKKHKIELVAAMPKGLKAKAFHDIFRRYFDASRAGAMLKAQG